MTMREREIESERERESEDKSYTKESYSTPTCVLLVHAIYMRQASYQKLLYVHLVSQEGKAFGVQLLNKPKCTKIAFNKCSTCVCVCVCVCPPA